MAQVVRSLPVVRGFGETSRRDRWWTEPLVVFLVLTGYVYTSSIIFLVGVELDELLRADAKAGQQGLLHMLGIARQ